MIFFFIEIEFEDHHKQTVQLQTQSDIEAMNEEAYSKLPEDEIIDFLNSTHNDEAIIVLGRQQINTQNGITMITIGSQSKLLATPGTQVQIYYEITNLHNEPTFHNFYVTDEQKYLTRLSVQNSWLSPSQTATIIVTAALPSNVEVGTRDKITFYAQGQTTVSQAAYLTVASSTGSQDNVLPSISYTYGSRCEGKIAAGQCTGNIWTLDIIAQDSESGKNIFV